ncbi:MMPL family transporter [Streptomyces sp. NPDC050534]|uniref:MMPL family transporter n=1 Tax=Streptomyces sp. NPDC050534 TaxID=3365625 RepID=UPI0037B88E17
MNKVLQWIRSRIFLSPALQEEELTHLPRPPAFQRHAGKFLGGFLLIALAAGVIGAETAARMSPGGYRYSTPAADRAVELLAQDFAIPARANFILTVQGDEDLRAGAPAAAGRRLVSRVRSHHGVTLVSDPFTTPQATYLLGSDARSALIVVQIAGDDKTAAATARALAHEVAEGELSPRASGTALVGDELIRGAQTGLTRAELFAFPLTFLILLLAFRSFAAACLPLLIGAIAIAVTLAVLRLLSLVIPVSVFAMNITTALGFGLAVDYSLFLLARYRRERAAGHPLDEALRTTVRTAGRAVAYSGLAVALSLAVLVLFPLYALSSLAYAAVSVVIVAAVAAVVVIPSLITVLGPRGDRWLVPTRPSRTAPWDIWGRLAHSVTNRPWHWALPLVAVLCLAAAPFTKAVFSPSDERLLPASSLVRTNAEQARKTFDVRQADPIWLVVTSRHTDTAALASYAETARHTRGVAEATLHTSPSSPKRAVLRVVPTAPPDSEHAAQTLARLRALPSPGPVTALGGTAERVSTLDALVAQLPAALSLLAAATFVLLFLFTGSLLLPLKALLMAALSLTAGFGVLVMVFQQGHLAPLLGGFEAPGYLDPSLVIVTACLCFGLATDYEMFLLSRIREEHQLTGDTRTATVTGTRETAAVMTSAATALTTVLLCLATSPLLMLKAIGVGSAVCVLIDAFLIRPVLVPAFLSILGPSNWWAPLWMHRLHRRTSRYGYSPAPPDPAHHPGQRDEFATTSKVRPR